MLAHLFRRWPKINPTMVQRLVFAEIELTRVSRTVRRSGPSAVTP